MTKLLNSIANRKPRKDRLDTQNRVSQSLNNLEKILYIRKTYSQVEIHYASLDLRKLMKECEENKDG